MPIQTFEDLNGKSLVNKAAKLINGYMHYLYKAAKNNNDAFVKNPNCHPERSEGSLRKRYYVIISNS